MPITVAATVMTPAPVKTPARPLVFFMRPWGGRVLDNAGGQDVLVRRISELGCDVVCHDWNKRSDAVHDVAQRYKGQLLCGVGVSCGANALTAVAREIGMTINYCAWVQPSRWCGMYPAWPAIPSNIKEAFVIYGSCARTLGFGCYCPPCEQQPALIAPDKSLYDGKWRMANKGKTSVCWKFVDDLHPADFDRRGVQDPILRDIARLMGSKTDISKLMARYTRP